ncbi:SDR family oxidoreductase [Streptomyces zingiberis]|uniref:NAD(P)H-binding protein n=1 Tax=Streptomyces zingiberis TaxID=2053010 RepID=A0ABX1C1H4_9ACTN|nr:NAD(P)H-binding protein [Streptomyces zingiberis]NJQ02525.1 NAD(P)H-binding protein [Streptomyces zingiberis]
MRFAVMGGTGLIGSQVVRKLRAAGHEATSHSRSTGVDLVTGEGIREAVEGAEVVIDLTKAPAFDRSAHAFYQATMDHLLTASREAGVRHVVILSIVGAERVPGDGYYGAKVLQEELVRAGSLPYSIVRSTQFMEFVDAVLTGTVALDDVRLPTTPLQPIAAGDVADVVAEVALGAPLRGIREIAGPEVLPLDQIGRRRLESRGERRTVIVDESAGLYAGLPGDALTAGPDTEIAPTSYADWLARAPG